MIQYSTLKLNIDKKDLYSGPIFIIQYSITYYLLIRYTHGR